MFLKCQISILEWFTKDHKKIQSRWAEFKQYLNLPYPNFWMVVYGWKCLPNAFKCIHKLYDQFILFLGIKSMFLVLLAACSTVWAGIALNR